MTAQAIEHYEISRYGTLIAWAQEFGHTNVTGLLNANLKEEKAADKKLNTLAEGDLNRKAVDAWRQRVPLAPRAAPEPPRKARRVRARHARPPRESRPSGHADGRHRANALDRQLRNRA